MIPSDSPFKLKSFRQQHLLLEFASLKHVQLQGVYVALSQGDPTVWNGVFFVRKGPYASAVLRFRMFFQATFPFQPPVITFLSDIFHPLITPLTTATYSAASSESDPDATAMQERLPPGALSLRHGFPGWFTRSSTPSASLNGALTDEDGPRHTDLTQIHMVDVLYYMRCAFEDATALDSVPFEAAGNPGAWYAWQAHRRKQHERREREERATTLSLEETPKKQSESSHARTPSKSAMSHGRSPSKSTPSHARTRSRGVVGTPGANGENSTPSRAKRPSEWNWEGVWEQRVKKAVNESVNEGTLFGSTVKDDDIRFTDIGREDMDSLVSEMRTSLWTDGEP